MAQIKDKIKLCEIWKIQNKSTHESLQSPAVNIDFNGNGNSKKKCQQHKKRLTANKALIGRLNV